MQSIYLNTNSEVEFFYSTESALWITNPLNLKPSYSAFILSIRIQRCIQQNFNTFVHALQILRQTASSTLLSMLSIQIYYINLYSILDCTFNFWILPSGMSFLYYQNVVSSPAELWESIGKWTDTLFSVQKNRSIASTNFSTTLSTSCQIHQY